MNKGIFELIILLRLNVHIIKKYRDKSSRENNAISRRKIHQTGRPQKMENFQEIAEKLKRSVKEQRQKKADIPVEAQLKIMRRERERQAEIDQEYRKRKEQAAMDLLRGLEELREQQDK